MKLLFDENLSFRLVTALADIYPDSSHVREVGLLGADDLHVGTMQPNMDFCWLQRTQISTSEALYLARRPRSFGYAPETAQSRKR
jgi:hypothetical protein